MYGHNTHTNNHMLLTCTVNAHMNCIIQRWYNSDSNVFDLVGSGNPAPLLSLGRLKLSHLHQFRGFLLVLGTGLGRLCLLSNLYLDRRMLQ